MNRLKPKETTINQEIVEEKKDTPSFFVSLFTGSFLVKENVVGALPFVLFLTFLGLLYIANGYNTEKLVRELDNINDELKELRSEYITIKSDLNYESKQSQVASKSELFGVNESTIPPTKIIISAKELKQIQE